MSLHELRPAPGSKTKGKRLGQGLGSGTGKTSGRGHKGQLSGAGYKAMRGFEGGQMPLVRRIPKRGFTNIFRHEPAVLNLDRLAKISGAEIGPADAALRKAGLASGKADGIKILGDGDLKRKLTVCVRAFSAAARAKIEGAGGRCESVAVVPVA